VAGTFDVPAFTGHITSAAWQARFFVRLKDSGRLRSSPAPAHDLRAPYSRSIASSLPRRQPFSIRSFISLLMT
jgi:hypothetical protein